MSDQEALQTIAAIARWAREEAPEGSASCADTVRALEELTRERSFEVMSDREAVRLFDVVLTTLQASDASVPAAA